MCEIEREREKKCDDALTFNLVLRQKIRTQNDIIVFCSNFLERYLKLTKNPDPSVYIFVYNPGLKKSEIHLLKTKMSNLTKVDN